MAALSVFWRVFRMYGVKRSEIRDLLTGLSK